MPPKGTRTPQPLAPHALTAIAKESIVTKGFLSGRGNSALFEIYYRNESRILHPTGWNDIDVYDFFLNRGEKIRKGTKGQALWKSGYWEREQSKA